MTIYTEAAENVTFRNSTIKKKSTEVYQTPSISREQCFIRLNHSLAFPFNKKQQSKGCSQPKLPYNFSTHPHSNHTKSLFNSNHPFWNSVSHPSQTLVE